MPERRLPTSQRELETLEAQGFWLAITLVSKCTKDRTCAMDTTMLCAIHREIFQFAMPGIGGRYRIAGEDIKKLHFLIPPPGRMVAQRMLEFGKELDAKIASIPLKPKTKRKDTYLKWVHRVVEVAAWTQHQIVAIHPFSNGNGRTARLFTNLILQSYGLPGSRVRFEKEDKDAYLNALAQIDKACDYSQLINLILRAMADQQQQIRDRYKKQLRRQ